MRMRAGLAGAAVALVTTLAAAPGALAKNAVYGGETSGDEAIVLTADKAGKTLRSAVIAWQADCGESSWSDGGLITPITSAPRSTDLLVSRNAKGRFAGKQHRDLGSPDQLAAVDVAFAGRMGATKASGTLSATVVITDRATGAQAASCTTGTVHWKATRAAGRVYGGRTSQDEPIVARLDAKRKRVTDLIVSWDSSSCDPDGSFHSAEHLGGFKVAPNGRFKDSDADVQLTPDGGVAMTTHDVAGRVSKRGARGTLQVDASWPDGSCSSGGVTWNASTG
jgi:hypothetical protein